LNEPAPTSDKLRLLGQTLADLERTCVALGLARFRAKQLCAALFLRRVQDFSLLSELSKADRALLSERCDLTRPTLVSVARSQDGTRKYRFAGHDGIAFEAVFIPAVSESGKTNTLCISSQTGCRLGCRFCFTAGFTEPRDLDAAQIIGQVLHVQDDVAKDDERVTNLVFMGMGEPLLNYDNVVSAARILQEPLGCGFSSRRVTISTAGVVPRLADLGRDLDTQLAISLNATTDAERDLLMPINKKWPLADLLAALRAYPLPNRRRITIEYVMVAGVNDALEDARRLPKLLSGLRVKVNLLPLNAHDRTELKPPSAETVERFAAELRRHGLNTIVRTPRGQDIEAACGQLGGLIMPR
jgi:23S rRNA (adenine2503-C2)-methyltransferase